MRSISLTLVLWALCSAGCASTEPETQVQAGIPVATDQGPVLAQVGELGGVTAADFAREAARRPSEGGGELTAEARRDLLDKLISDEALLQEAAKQGLFRDPRVRRSVVNLLIKEEVTRQVESMVFTNEQLRAYYDTHLEDFIIPENVQVMRIFLSVGEDRTEAQALALARDLRDQVAGDLERFRELAMAHSEDPYARRGGDLGYITPSGKAGVDPEVVQQAMALDVGGVSEPFVAGGGVNLIHVPKKRDKIERTFEQMKGSVLRKLKNERHQELSEAFVAEVRERYAVTVDEAALAGVEIQQTRIGGPAGMPLNMERPPLPTFDAEDTD